MDKIEVPPLPQFDDEPELPPLPEFDDEPESKTNDNEPEFTIQPLPLNPTTKQRVEELIDAPTAEELAVAKEARNIANGFKRTGRKRGDQEEVRCLKDQGYCKFLGAVTAWYKHNIITHCAPLYRCKICNKAYHFQCQIMFHAADHIDVKRFQCSVCMKPFKNKKSIENHVLVRHKITQRDSGSHIIKYW